MTDSINNPDLARDREICNGAVRGPWTQEGVVMIDGPDGMILEVGFGLRDDAEMQSTVAFIAHARTRLPELIDEVERLRERLEYLKAFEPRVHPYQVAGEIAATVPQDFFATLVQGLDSMNGEANYTTTEITCRHRTYEVQVRRKDKPTPHELRKAATVERDALQVEVERLRAENKSMRDVLESVEWEGYESKVGEEIPACPECCGRRTAKSGNYSGGQYWFGHTPDCRLAAAINSNGGSVRGG